MIRGSAMSAEFNKNKFKERKRLKKLKWPKSFEQDVDITKIDNKEVSAWIESKVVQILGFDDDVLIGTIQNSIIDAVPLDPRILHTTLEPFLGEQTTNFMEELWQTMLSGRFNCASKQTENNLSGNSEGFTKTNQSEKDDFLTKYERERQAKETSKHMAAEKSPNTFSKDNNLARSSRESRKESESERMNVHRPDNSRDRTINDRGSENGRVKAYRQRAPERYRSRSRERRRTRNRRPRSRSLSSEETSDSSYERRRRRRRRRRKERSRRKHSSSSDEGAGSL